MFHSLKKNPYLVLLCHMRWLGKHWYVGTWHKMQTQARFLQHSVGSIWTDLWLGQTNGASGVHEAKRMEKFRDKCLLSKLWVLTWTSVFVDLQTRNAWKLLCKNQGRCRTDQKNGRSFESLDNETVQVNWKYTQQETNQQSNVVCLWPWFSYAYPEFCHWPQIS